MPTLNERYLLSRNENAAHTIRDDIHSAERDNSIYPALAPPPETTPLPDVPWPGVGTRVVVVVLAIGLVWRGGGRHRTDSVGKFARVTGPDGRV